MCSHAPAYTQCQILCCYTCGSVSAGATYPCRATLWHVVTEGTCEFRYSLQFIFVGPVYHNTLTNRAALLSPRGPSLALRAIHLVPHPALIITACVAERYLTLRICGYMDVQSASCGRKNPLSRPYSLSSLNFRRAIPKGNGSPQEGRNRRCLPFWFPRRETAAVLSLRKRPSPR